MPRSAVLNSRRHPITRAGTFAGVRSGQGAIWALGRSASGLKRSSNDCMLALSDFSSPFHLCQLAVQTTMRTETKLLKRIGKRGLALPAATLYDSEE
eukprot:4213698-Amphidinium_carterae.1